MHNYKTIGEFRFWVQKVLPVVYDDSLSYYELVSKICAKLNELINSQNELLDNFGSDMRETVEKILQQWIDDGTIEQYLNNVVIVNDYGAKGDGVTDDTEAIQRCVDANPGSHIIFKAGTYLISDTIHLFGHAGGQYVDLGGSTIKWIGAESLGAVMFSVDKLTGETGFHCTITNGNLNGDAKCGIAIKNWYFHTCITNIKLYDFTYIGILIGEIDGSRADVSTQMLISNCTLTQSIGGYSTEDTYGIFIASPDNLITNTNIAYFGWGYCLKVGGNDISNGHITIWYKNAETVTPEMFVHGNILVAPFSTGQRQLNTFDTMYFNAGKYVVYVDSPGTGDIYQEISISNSHYTFYSARFSIPQQLEVFIVGGDANMRVWIDNFNINTGNNVTVYDYFTERQSSRTLMLVNKYDLIHSGVYHTTDEFIDARHLSNDDVRDYIGGYALAAGNYRKIGTILNNYRDVGSIYGLLDIEAVASHYGKRHGVFRVSGGSVESDTVYTFGGDNIDFYIGQAYQKTIAGVEYECYDLYAYNKTEAAIGDTRTVRIGTGTGYCAKIYIPTPDLMQTTDTDSVSGLTKIL